MIHPTAKIHATAVIYPGVTIGAHTRIGAFAVIGGPPEHKDFWHETKFSVHIGDNCFINHHVTIDSGTTGHTLIGNGCTILRHAHVGHDAVVGDGSTLSCSVLIGGHSIILPFANCGLGAIVHQNMVIGPVAMLGMGTIVTKKTPIAPFTIYTGNPARALRMNTLGVERSGLTNVQLEELADVYTRLIRQKT